MRNGVPRTKPLSKSYMPRRANTATKSKRPSPRRRSQAWKDLERAVAKAVNGDRVSRGGDFSKSAVDVEVADLPFLKIDAKYRKSHAHHSLIDEVAEKYCKKDVDVPILVTKSHGQEGANVTMPMYFFSVLIKTFRDANVDEHLGAVAKAKTAYAKDMPDKVGRFDRACQNCSQSQDSCDCCVFNCRCSCCTGRFGAEYCSNHYERPAGWQSAINTGLSSCGCAGACL